MPTNVIISIPLSKIRPNPDNPRGPVDPLEAKAMAESLKEVGQKTPVKVRPLTEAEKNLYPPYEYLLIGGHVRLEGAKLAGLETLRAEVVEPGTPGEEFDDALLDNRSSDMGWWRWDLAIEKRMQLAPKITQEKLGLRWGFNPTKISYALKILRVMTPEARKTVDINLGRPKSKNKGFLITESILLVLADLGDPNEVEKALGRVLDDEMGEDQVRQMVKAHLSPGPQAGGQELVVPSQGAEGNGGTKGGSALKKGGSVSKPSPLEGEGRVRGASGSVLSASNPIPISEPQTPSAPAPTPSQGLWATLSGLFKGSHSSKGSQALVLGGLGGVVGGFLAANLKRALGTLTRRWMLHGLLGLGVAGFFVTRSLTYRDKSHQGASSPRGKP